MRISTGEAVNKITAHEVTLVLKINHAGEERAELPDS